MKAAARWAVQRVKGEAWHRGSVTEVPAVQSQADTWLVKEPGLYPAHGRSCSYPTKPEAGSPLSPPAHTCTSPGTKDEVDPEGSE